jgi:hypothetical protein
MIGTHPETTGHPNREISRLSGALPRFEGGEVG